MIKPVRIDLHEAVETAIEIFRIQLRSNNITWRNMVKPGTAVLANPAYLESIVMNIISNAIKYRHPQREPVVELMCRHENGFVVLTVSDNGLGIDLGKHGKDVFGMYKTFHENTDAQGIGLFITKYHVEAMGGWIALQSKPDRGTTVTVHLKSAQ